MLHVLVNKVLLNACDTTVGMRALQLRVFKGMGLTDIQRLTSVSITPVHTRHTPHHKSTPS
jgi:hypothetical protein